MSRRINIDEIELEICNVVPFANDTYEGVKFEWESKIGFGEYMISKKVGTNQWYADSECMDRDEDKSFIEHLLKLFVEQLVIEG